MYNRVVVMTTAWRFFVSYSRANIINEFQEGNCISGVLEVGA
jgi:hypothetical protein